MNRFCTALVAAAMAIPALVSCAPSSDMSNQEVAAAARLCSRVAGSRARDFVFRQTEHQADFYAISSERGRIVIEGSCANAMAAGLGHYLKYWCNAEYGWLRGQDISLPRRLPVVEEPYCSTALVDVRFFLNYCTYGYSMPWWKWEDWEHMIDWMALCGVNTALAITGQESVWYQIWTELGLSDEEVRSYFTGPAHLPWHRMQNLDRWGGPLPHSWLDGQMELQKQICARERELGITPVLPAFSGHVPAELSRIYPDAPITKLEPWDGIPDEYACSFLDPMSELYAQIQKKFIAKEKEIYGDTHIYGLDVFNELTPPSWEPEYLARVSNQIYGTLKEADPEATWLQMGWMFYWNHNWTQDRLQAYLNAFPVEHQLMLDYFCELEQVWKRSEQFYGVPYIWCYLGNFGGNTELVGDIHNIEARLAETMKDGGSNFAGIGSTLEGIDCNPFVYEYLFEKAWDSPVAADIDQWVRRNAARRSGVEGSAEAEAAWKALADTVYRSHAFSSMQSFVAQKPNIGRAKAFYAPPQICYDNATLGRILGQLIEADGKGTAYEFDLVNIARQLLCNRFDSLKRSYDEAYGRRDREQMRLISAEELELLEDLDELLGTHSYFLVGKWIADARSWGGTEQESDFLESNAREIVTVWSYADQQLNEYACRVWNGITGSYYKTRYEIFFRAVESCLDEGGEWDDARYDAYNKEIVAFEDAWWKERIGSFPSEPTGEPVAAARKVYDKYIGRI